MVLHQTFLHLGRDRDMAGWHGSTGHVPRIHCWCLAWTNPANCPAVCWSASRPLGFIYLQYRIDRPSVFTPLFTTLVMARCTEWNVAVVVKCCWWFVSAGRCPLCCVWAVSPSCCWEACTMSLISKAGGAGSHSYTQVLLKCSQRMTCIIQG